MASIIDEWQNQVHKNPLEYLYVLWETIFLYMFTVKQNKHKVAGKSKGWLDHQILQSIFSEQILHVTGALLESWSHISTIKFGSSKCVIVCAGGVMSNTHVKIYSIDVYLSLMTQNHGMLITS